MKPYLWDPWATAATDPDRTAVIADEEEITYGELVGRADALASGLRARGLPDGATVSTDIPTGPAFFALALAALRHGYGLFPIDPDLLELPLGASLLDSVATTAHISAEPREGGPDPLRPVWTDAELTTRRADRVRASGLPPAAGRLVFATSGTTGLPQAVTRARPRRPYRGVAVVERYGAGAGRGPHLMANPTYHLGTLGPALYALQAGSTVVVQRHWSPGAFAELAERHRADSAMLSPDRLTDVVEAGEPSYDRFRVLFHGGAACPPSVKRAAIGLFGPVLHEYYGTSQGVLTEITTAEWLARPGSVGRPLAGIRVEITRDGRPLPAGETGDIDIRPRAADRDPSDGDVLKTGDVGHVDDEGYLFVLGRAESPRGIRLARLEQDIRLLPGVTDAAVLDGADEVPVCFVEHRGGSVLQDPLPAIEATADMLELSCPQVVLAAPGSLPRTPSGKLRRAALLDLPRSAPHAV
ncbi:class I adenylate-forming enzyme family protein [Streptomyces sp. NPDC091280]|uniref:class I adenylate-forming enzyme family protein n=1 Tax=Streptomyces sp. NPDC091280 TaxID=3365984 RepID=UPI00382724F5